MNLIIGCDDLKFACRVVKLVEQETGLQPILYNFANGQNPHATSLPGKWIVIGTPRSSAEYRQMCRDGYSPDLVVCIGQLGEYRNVNQLSEFYEGMVSSFIGDVAWIVHKIKKIIEFETKPKK